MLTNKAGISLIRKAVRICVGVQELRKAVFGTTFHLRVQRRLRPEKYRLQRQCGLKIRQQAGMSKLMSDVRSYVGGYRQRAYVSAAILEEKTGKGEKHPLHPGMCQRINSLAGYAGDGQRDNWDC